MANLVKSAFIVCVFSVFVVSFLNCHPGPVTHSSSVDAATVFTDENARPCQRGGDRESQGEYCGFGWRMYDWSGTKDSEPMGTAIWNFTKLALMLPFMIITAPFMYMSALWD